MTWFKLDDKSAFHAKVLAAGDAAWGLLCRAGAWSSGALTDGHIPPQVARQLCSSKARWTALQAAGLIDQASDGGWQIHDFLEWNPSAIQVRAKQQARAEAGRRGGMGSAATRSAQANGVANDEAKAKQLLPDERSKREAIASPKIEPPSRPVPSREDLAKAGSSVCAVTSQSPDTSQHTHTQPEPAMGDERRARILAELQRHPNLVEVADEEFAAVLDGRAFHAGRPLEAVLVAISDAAADLAPGTLAAVVRQRVRQYADRAQRPRTPSAEPGRGQGATDGGSPCPASADASTGAWLADNGLPSLASSEGAEVGRMLDHYAGLGERRASWSATWAKWRSSPHPKATGPHPTIAAAQQRKELRASVEVAEPTMEPGATKALIGGVLAALGGA